MNTGQCNEQKEGIALSSLIRKIKIYNLIRFDLFSHPQPNINKYK